MRVFEKPNLTNNWKCPICKLSTKEPVVLVGIAGTEEDNIMQADQYHLECIDLVAYRNEQQKSTLLAMEIKDG